MAITFVPSLNRSGGPAYFVYMERRTDGSVHGDAYIGTLRQQLSGNWTFKTQKIDIDNSCYTHTITYSSFEAAKQDIEDYLFIKLL